MGRYGARLTALPPHYKTFTNTTPLPVAAAARRAPRKRKGQQQEEEEEQGKVVVLLEEGPMLPVTELAILLAKMVIVPLDGSDPRLPFVLQDVNPTAILTKDEEHSAKVLAFLEQSAAATVPLSHTIGNEVQPAEAPRESKQGRVASLPPYRVLSIEALLAGYASGEGEAEEEAAATSTGAERAEEETDEEANMLSHIVFTSGSTGRPKGCIISRRALAVYCAAKNEAHQVTQESVCFVASPHTFDPSLGDFFATWWEGGTLALAPRSLIFTCLGGCLATTRASHVQTTPSLFRTLRQRTASGDGRGDTALEYGPAQLPWLQVVALGGEPMPSRMVQRWAPHVMLLNTYGVTECCVYQAFAVLSSASMDGRTLTRPLRGTTLFLMSLQEEEEKAKEGGKNEPKGLSSLVPERSGQQGELWIGGLQVGQGYLNRPELTQQRFLEHPLYGKCFRTGDIAIALPEGGWRLLGRYDAQVKLAGQRVELGEIEEVLLSVASPSLVQAVAVVLTRSQFGTKQLVAWCVPSPPSCNPPDEDDDVDEQGKEEVAAEQSVPSKKKKKKKPKEVESNRDGPNDSINATDQHQLLLAELLRWICEHHLPRHMVPARFCFLDELPVSPTGKVARTALSKRPLPATPSAYSALEDMPYNNPNTEVAVGSATSSHPLTPLEQKIGEVWAEELGLPYNFLHSSSHFQELGGDSLAALRVCRQLAHSFQQQQQKAAENETREEEQQGLFGELLGPLSPAELLKRPKLSDYALYLLRALTPAAAVSNCRNDRLKGGESNGSDASSTGVSASPDNVLDWQRRPHQLVSLLYRGAAAGATQLVNFILDSGSVDANGELLPKTSTTTPTCTNSSSSRHLTPLHSACANQQLRMAKLLLQRGASWSLPDQHGVLPIHLAAQKGPVQLVETLLKAGSPLLAKDHNQQTVLHHAARAGAPGKLLEALLKHCTLLRQSTSSSHRNKKKQQNQSDGSGIPDGLEWRDQWERTPLHWAVINGHRTAVLRLLEAGASLKTQDMAGETALQMAERRARCGASERPDGVRTSVFGDIAKLLGGSGATKNVTRYASVTSSSTTNT
ncbi:putative peptide synthase SimD6, variant 2 [Balamuthia mandrillaris]